MKRFLSVIRTTILLMLFFNKYKKLIHTYEEYIKLLNDELKVTAFIAFSNGWESENIEKGKELRENISNLKKDLRL